MATRVLITVDTELMWRPDAARGGWEALFARSYDPAGVGVPWQLARLAAHDLKATFFVDPMPACAFGIEPLKRMIAPILEAGQDVQLHLHPNWSAPDARFELIDWDEPGQRELIDRARALLIAAGAPAPLAFRAGSYGANDATLRALASLGIRYDSSHNGGHAPWPSAIALPADQIAPIEHAGVVELPVTQIGDSDGLRHLQICAVSIAELRAALDHAAREGHPAVTIVSHSFELASRNGLRPNAVHVRRFEALCEHLAERRIDLPTAWFSELADLPLGRPARPLPADRWRGLARKAEQFWSNRYHERGS